MNAQPFEYIAVVCCGLTAFFIMFQVAIYGDEGKGWIDRPWYIRLFMFCVGVSMIYKVWAFARQHEHFTMGGAIIGYCFCAWQFSSLLYAITTSYRERAEAIARNLLPLVHGWRVPVPVHNIGKQRVR